MMAMRFTLLMAVILLPIVKTFAQVALLNEYDFSQGDHTLLLLPHRPNTYSGEVDTTGMVAYYDQEARQNPFKWQLVLADRAPASGYSCPDYLSIKVCKNGKALETLTISEGCNTIKSNEGVFRFAGYLPLKGYKIARRNTHIPRTLTQARSALDSLRRLEDIILVPEPEWHHFDGKLHFTRTGMQGTMEAVLALTKKEIKNRFPGEPFQVHVQQTSYGSQDFAVQLWCTKAMHKQFDLYPALDKQWEPFSQFRLDSYHRMQ
jgi:hypothetical protein